MANELLQAVYLFADVANEPPICAFYTHKTLTADRCVKCPATLPALLLIPA